MSTLTTLRLIKNLICASLLMISSNVYSDINWKVSPSRTNVKFKVKHFVLMEVQGHFKNAEGLVFTPTDKDFSNAKVEARIPIASISTGNEDRDLHLKQAVFFNADKFPEMVFKSTKVINKGSNLYEMHGDLKIRGVVRPVILEVVHSGESKSSDGHLRSKFIATGSINRYQFGLNWNELTEAGGVLVGEEVQIELDVTLEKVETELANATQNSYFSLLENK